MLFMNVIIFIVNDCCPTVRHNFDSGFFSEKCWLSISFLFLNILPVSDCFIEQNERKYLDVNSGGHESQGKPSRPNQFYLQNAFLA